MLLRGRILAYFAKVKIIETPKTKITEAVRIIKEKARAKFDETIDFQLRLNVDPKHGDQNVRGTCILPGGLGKNVKIAVLVSNDLNDVAQRAGADFVGQEEILKSIKDGTYTFEKLISTQDMLTYLKPFARLLGTKGLMPNPKAGTLVLPQDLTTAIRGAKAGTIEFRVDASRNIMVPVGKKSFDEKTILLNIKAFSTALNLKRPQSIKGQLIREARIKTTMGAPVEVDIMSFDQRYKENELKDLV